MALSARGWYRGGGAEHWSAYTLGMSARRTAVTIGNFDGVHAGHAALVAACREEVGPGGRVVVLAFDAHPRSVLAPGTEPARLTTFARKAALLQELGADAVHRLVPDAALLGLTAGAFMGHVVREFAPAVLVEGSDFHFGKGRDGDVGSLTRLGETLGFAVRVVEPVEVELADQSVVRASSTVARWLLDRGRAGDAAAVLGRPYEIEGGVVRGDRRGRTAGFPTVNIAAETMLPADGVYAGWAELPDGRRFPAAINVGERPTVGGVERRVEAHVLGLPTSWDGVAKAGAWAAIDGVAEYGWRCRLSVLAWVRDQVRFGSFAELVGQLGRDCARVVQITGARACVGSVA